MTFAFNKVSDRSVGITRKEMMKTWVHETQSMDDVS